MNSSFRVTSLGGIGLPSTGIFTRHPRGRRVVPMAWPGQVYKRSRNQTPTWTSSFLLLQFFWAFKHARPRWYWPTLECPFFLFFSFFACSVYTNHTPRFTHQCSLVHICFHLRWLIPRTLNLFKEGLHTSNFIGDWQHVVTVGIKATASLSFCVRSHRKPDRCVKPCMVSSPSPCGKNKLPPTHTTRSDLICWTKGKPLKYIRLLSLKTKLRPR